MMMAHAAVLILITLLVLVGLPGWLVFRVWLRNVGLSWRVGIAVVLAAQSVFFSNAAAIVGYSVGLMLTISVLTLMVAIIVWYWGGFSRFSDSEKSRKSAPTESAREH